MNDIVARLTGALGPEVVTPGAHTPERSMHDWSGLAPARPLALVRPRNTTEVATALRLCNETGTPVVPQGGLSGISGGAHPVADAVSISLERMNAIESIDREMATITLGAGTVLQTAQEAAAEHDLLLGVDLGARGSCTVGGVISTNAGGNQVIRYGMTRDHVLGVEAVLADGTIVSSMNTMIKNNAGLDLKQLFIGSEGLMGIVTRAVMRLHPRPAYTGAAFCGCPDTASVIAMLKRARSALGPQLTSFEVMWPSFFDFMSSGIGAKSPLAAAHGVYVIVEASGFAEAPLRTALESCLESAFEAGEVEDAVLAASAREEKELWAVRESVAEYGRAAGTDHGFRRRGAIGRDGTGGDDTGDRTGRTLARCHCPVLRSSGRQQSASGGQCALGRWRAAHSRNQGAGLWAHPRSWRDGFRRAWHWCHQARLSGIQPKP